MTTVLSKEAPAKNISDKSTNHGGTEGAAGKERL